VNKQADCKSYDVKGKKARNDNVMYEVGEDNFGAQNIENTLVSCDAARCLFNDEQYCRANGISVVCEKRNNAACATFTPR
jgi:hypothetical protein